jgi:hypothetical protein
LEEPAVSYSRLCPENTSRDRRKVRKKFRESGILDEIRSDDLQNTNLKWYR